MTAVIQIVGLATGEPSSADGLYVQAYSPNGNGGRGDLVLTNDVTEAYVYETSADALEDWKRVSETHPTREDGKPNRPMTAFSVAALKR